MNAGREQGVWADVVGQPDTVATLRAAVEVAARTVAGETISGADAGMTHSWLFTGPPGSGRSVAARAFAAALHCPRGGCGECTQCHTVLAGTHADVRVIAPEGLSIGVDEMRDLVRTAARRPSLGRWHVIIMEDADRLTERAGNALLKAVEEPPARTVFLLCAPSSHPDDISITLRSRCRLVPLRVPSDAAVAEVLVRRDGVDPPRAAWAARAAQGHVGRARRLARDEQARIRRKAVLDIPMQLRTLADCFAAAEELVGGAKEEAAELAARRDGPEATALREALGGGGTGKGAVTAGRGAAAALKDLERQQRLRTTRAQRDALDRALVDLAGLYRDVLTVQTGARVGLFHVDRETDVRRLARSMPPEGTLVRIEAILHAREALELNVKQLVAMEAMTVVLRSGEPTFG